MKIPRLSAFIALATGIFITAGSQAQTVVVRRVPVVRTVAVVSAAPAVIVKPVVRIAPAVVTVVPARIVVTPRVVAVRTAPRRVIIY